MTSADACQPILVGGAYNFRDVGGYPTHHRHMVARGLVFRSASLSALTEHGLAKLASLKINLVLDLRSTSERVAEPTTVSDIEVWSRDYDASGADLLRLMQQPGASADTAVSMMLATYRNLIEEQAEAFGEMFRRIARGSAPLVVHCAAGKDRTGVAVALLLDLLGVPRDAIEKDYLLTQFWFDQSWSRAHAILAHHGVEVIDDAPWRPIFAADARYLAAAFDEIDRRYGSSANYIRQRLRLTEADVADIRTAMLIDRAPLVVTD